MTRIQATVTAAATVMLLQTCTGSDPPDAAADTLGDFAEEVLADVDSDASDAANTDTAADSGKDAYIYPEVDSIITDIWSSSPGCGQNSYTSPMGCLSCTALAAELPAAVSAAVATSSACQVDEDCAEAISWQRICNFDCPLVLAKDATAAGIQAYLALGAAWCPQSPKPHSVYCNYPCKQGILQCVAGYCRKVGLCDPLVAGPGASCDDGNACTVKDVCYSPGVCKGQPASCNDDNPCTADSCVATSGCVNMPVAASCSSGISCSIGASCQAGQCADTGLQGWSKKAYGPAAFQSARMAQWPGGGYGLAVRIPSSKMKIKRFSASGSQLWETSAGPDNPSLAGVAALQGGQFAVVGNHYPPPSTISVPYLLRLDGAGSVLGTYTLPIANAEIASLTAGPAGLLLVGVHSNGKNTKNSWSALLTTDAQLQWLADIPGTVQSAGPAFAASGAGGYAVLATVPGANTAYGDQGDVRFVGLDFQGNVVAETTWPSPDNDYPSGIAALAAGGWLIASAATVIDPKTQAKSSLGLLRIVDIAGKLVSETVNPAARPVAFANQSSGLTLVAASDLQGGSFGVQPVGPTGQLSAGWTIPWITLGTVYPSVVVESDGSAVLLRSAASSNTLDIFRIWPACAGQSCPNVACNPTGP